MVVLMLYVLFYRYFYIKAIIKEVFCKTHLHRVISDKLVVILTEVRKEPTKTDLPLFSIGENITN